MRPAELFKRVDQRAWANHHLKRGASPQLTWDDFWIELSCVRAGYPVSFPKQWPNSVAAMVDEDLMLSRVKGRRGAENPFMASSRREIARSMSGQGVPATAVRVPHGVIRPSHIYQMRCSVSSQHYWVAIRANGLVELTQDVTSEETKIRVYKFGDLWGIESVCHRRMFLQATSTAGEQHQDTNEGCAQTNDECDMGASDTIDANGKGGEAGTLFDLREEDSMIYITINTPEGIQKVVPMDGTLKRLDQANDNQAAFVFIRQMN